MNLPRLQKGGVDFVHGDIRNREDLLAIDPFDLILECSAEPSILAGYSGSPDYVVNTNLMGTINCLELARFHGADMVFLSTSRVYPIETINGLNFVLESAHEDWTKHFLWKVGDRSTEPPNYARNSCFRNTSQCMA